MEEWDEWQEVASVLGLTYPLGTGPTVFMEVQENVLICFKSRRKKGTSHVEENVLIPRVNILFLSQCNSKV